MTNTSVVDALSRAGWDASLKRVHQQPPLLTLTMSSSEAEVFDHGFVQSDSDSEGYVPPSKAAKARTI